MDTFTQFRLAELWTALSVQTDRTARALACNAMLHQQLLLCVSENEGLKAQLLSCVSENEGLKAQLLSCVSENEGLKEQLAAHETVSDQDAETYLVAAIQCDLRQTKNDFTGLMQKICSKLQKLEAEVLNDRKRLAESEVRLNETRSELEVTKVKLERLKEHYKVLGVKMSNSIEKLGASTESTLHTLQKYMTDKKDQDSFNIAHIDRLKYARQVLTSSRDAIFFSFETQSRALLEREQQAVNVKELYRKALEEIKCLKFRCERADNFNLSLLKVVDDQHAAAVSSSGAIATLNEELKMLKKN
jgi:hypothetical protein